MSLNNNNQPLPMQYLGSKARIAPWIINNLKNAVKGKRKLFDLFSGTGSVAIEGNRNGYELAVNDFEPYAYCVLRSLFFSPRDELDNAVKMISLLSDEDLLVSNDRAPFKDLLVDEARFFRESENGHFDWEAYKKFCDNTTHVSGDHQIIDEMRKENKSSLFINYYANTYFGIKQCLQLDTIRELSQSCPQSARDHINAAVISAMTYGVSSTTHLAQYLRPNSEKKALHLLNRRRFDFLPEVTNRLSRIKNTFIPHPLPRVFNCDYLEALAKGKLDESWIVYADPPYFKEHYSRYYHVLNTFLLYDYPYLTYNPVTKDITEGRYRLERKVSNFGKKSTVEKAFGDLFFDCKNRGYTLSVSYAETSLVKREKLIALAEHFGLANRLHETQILHSSQGKYNNKTVTEYFFIFQT